MSIRLNKKEREAIEWLNKFTSALLNGEAIEFEKPIVDQLKKMGIDVGFVIHKEVAELVRGKEDPYYWRITNAPNFLKGRCSKQYLPFQIKETKNLK